MIVVAITHVWGDVICKHIIKFLLKHCCRPWGLVPRPWDGKARKLLRFQLAAIPLNTKGMKVGTQKPHKGPSSGILGHICDSALLYTPQSHPWRKMSGASGRLQAVCALIGMVHQHDLHQSTGADQ
jgi:hypothetical protein